VVTGEGDSYRVPNASTATRTDTPLRDIPQSIQVVPQEVLRDRNAQNVFEAVETVSGVLDGSNNYGAPGGTNIIRGFISFDSGNLRNGFRDYDYYSVSSIGTIEQVEVLKGPASVLFSAQEPGGVINTVTKKPLNTPYYNVEFQAGNYGFYQPSVDLSGPLTKDGNALPPMPIPMQKSLKITLLPLAINWTMYHLIKPVFGQLMKFKLAI
jgi:iron complex outermembrane recepter protein